MDIKDLIVNYNYLVIRNQVLSFLEVNDLLRLRTVSKAFKMSVEDYTRTQKVKTTRNAYIDFRGSNPIKVQTKSRNHVRDLREMNDFMKHSDLPIKTGATILFPEKSSLLNISARFQYFLETFTRGSSITRLYLIRLQLPLSCARMANFFDLFPNLTNLKIENVVAASVEEIPSTSSSDQEVKLPLSLTKLKRLHIMDFRYDKSQTVATQNAFDYVARIVETCLPTLEHLELSFYEFILRGVSTQNVVSLACKCLFDAPFLKLELVHGEFIELLLKPDNQAPETPLSLATIMRSINDKVTSIFTPRYNSFLLQLPNLEEILFSGSRMPELDDFVRREWPKLKEISLCLDDFQDDEEYEDSNLFKVWKFLFGGGIHRKNVADLSMKFGGFTKGKIRQRNQRTMELMTSCPNLKILHLEGKIKQLVNIQKLWNGLPLLEELTFCNCEDLEDSDFIGDDLQNPAFWNLKRLKGLEIKNLDFTKVTDRLLNKVICQMPLKKLTLSCRSCPVGRHSITPFGIRSLLKGQFASTIERLDISDLCDVFWTNNGNADLESLFRSSKM